MDVLRSSRRSGVPLEELLERADFVSLHCPLTPATRHLIGTGRARAMKPSAYLDQHRARGVVDQVALRLALLAGEIAGAALDVTDPEPLPATTRCSRRRTCSSSRTSARRPCARAQRWPRWRSRTCSPRSPAGRCRTRSDVRVAVVDIGTNSTRLLVAEVARRRRASSSALDRHPARARASTPRPARRRAAASACSPRSTSTPRRSSATARAALAVLTSAVRDAANGAEFAAAVRERYGLDARTLDGDEEARLTYLGATAARDAPTTPLLVIDIGGGSTELVSARAASGLPRLHPGRRRAPHRAPPARDPPGRGAATRSRATCARSRGGVPGACASACGGRRGRRHGDLVRRDRPRARALRPARSRATSASAALARSRATLAALPLEERRECRACTRTARPPSSPGRHPAAGARGVRLDASRSRARHPLGCGHRRHT
jgi:hypothetical protein